MQRRKTKNFIMQFQINLWSQFLWRISSSWSYFFMRLGNQWTLDACKHGLVAFVVVACDCTWVLMTCFLSLFVDVGSADLCWMWWDIRSQPQIQGVIFAALVRMVGWVTFLLTHFVVAVVVMSDEKRTSDTLQWWMPLTLQCCAFKTCQVSLSYYCLLLSVFCLTSLLFWLLLL